MNITKEQFEKLTKESVSKSEVCRKLNIAGNGTGMRLVAKLATEYQVDISHFSHKAAMSRSIRKYEIIVKSCPVCSNEFEAQKGHPKEKTTCSYGCSNTFFAEKRNIPSRYKNYRTICFKKWKRECLICGYDRIIHVHHLNGNHTDNSIENLIPLCSNHHEEIHSPKYFNELQECLVTKYQLHPSKKFKGSSDNFISGKKHKWPSIDEINKLGNNVVAKQMNVPVSYVRKHLKNVNHIIAE